MSQNEWKSTSKKLHSGALAASTPTSPVDISSALHITIMGESDTAATVTIEYSQDSEFFYGNETLALPNGKFAFTRDVAARLLRLTNGITSIGNLTALVAMKI